MPLWIFEKRHYHRLDPAMADVLNKVNSNIGSLLTQVRAVMIDTSKLLAEVARQKTDNDSLRALVEANTKAQAASSAALADAIAKLDASGANTAALEAIQADIDKATNDLAVDSTKSEAALSANVPPAPPAPVAPVTPAPAPVGVAPTDAGIPGSPGVAAPAPSAPIDTGTPPPPMGGTGTTPADTAPTPPATPPTTP